MARYLYQFSYSQDSAKGMVKKPQDRRAAAEKVVTAAGGKLIDFYFCFGDYDGVAISEFPSNVDAASAALAVAASGGFTKFKTTVLLTAAESVEAMKKAGKASKAYKSPAD